MLFLPSNLSPENVFLDANQSYTFSWTNNGDSQTDFQVYIYDMYGNLKESTGKVTSSTSSVSINLLGKLDNGYSYYWNVRVWHGANSALSGNVSFKAAESPTVTLEATPTVEQNYTFYGTVTTYESNYIQKFKFILYDDDDVIIQDYGWVYGLTVSQEVVGLASDTPYKIECIVVDQYNLQATTGKVSFQVTYSTPLPVPLFTITVDDDDGSMQLDWARVCVVLGHVSGTSEYVSGITDQALYLHEGAYLYFMETIPEEFTINLWIKLDATFTGNIITLGAFGLEWRYFYDGEYFGYEMPISLSPYRSFITVGTTPRTLPADFFLIAIQYGKMIVKTDTYTDII